MSHVRRRIAALVLRDRIVTGYNEVSVSLPAVLSDHVRDCPNELSLFRRFPPVATVFSARVARQGVSASEELVGTRVVEERRNLQCPIQVLVRLSDLAHLISLYKMRAQLVRSVLLKAPPCFARAKVDAVARRGASVPRLRLPRALLDVGVVARIVEPQRHRSFLRTVFSLQIEDQTNLDRARRDPALLLVRKLHAEADALRLLLARFGAVGSDALGCQDGAQSGRRQNRHSNTTHGGATEGDRRDSLDVAGLCDVLHC
jgi:hypothetical protein